MRTGGRISGRSALYKAAGTRRHFSVLKSSSSFAVDNFRSRRVMEKLGMTFERTGESVKFDGSETFKTNIFSKILNDDKI
mgnify:CR=1 FL=1